ncbi:hypothetical protein HYZ64_03850, partial [Candidatus Berkelbacteria bacterium]|nr:hypothetical protein [Candidatus Berkelbacteria bacterium]
MLPVLYIGATTAFLNQLPTLTDGVTPSISGLDSSPSAEELRNTIARLQWQPFHTDREWLVILRVDQLSEAAASALLKFLEEPPSSVSILLQATTLALLPTIRSRVSVRHLVAADSGAALAALQAMSFPERLKSVEQLAEQVD